MQAAWLADRYRLPRPRGGLRSALVEGARAAADVSDGLIADAGHIAQASGVGLELDLARLPISMAASAWLDTQPDEAAARLSLATGGDDYEIVCAAPPAAAKGMIAAASGVGLALTDIGQIVAGGAVAVRFGDSAVQVSRTGYRHDASSH